MYKKIAWLRPRSYSLYPQKSRRYRRLLIAIAPVLITGVWFVLPKHQSAVVASLNTPTEAAQSVSVAKDEVRSQPTLPDTPVAAAQPLADARYIELQDQVNAWVKRQPKSQQWSVVVQDTASEPNRVELNPRATYYMASLYKLFETIPLSQKIPFGLWQTTQISTDAGSRSVANCVDMMISKSDNPCGEAVGKTVGWASVTKAAKTRGMTDTTLSSSDFKSSARDVTTFMLGLEQGKWFDAPTRQSLLDSLAHQKLRAGIPAGCRGCTVLNKTGDLNGYRHDAALVTHGDSKFVLVVMSNGGSNAQIADVSRLVATKL